MTPISVERRRNIWGNEKYQNIHNNGLLPAHFDADVTEELSAARSGYDTGHEKKNSCQIVTYVQFFCVHYFS